MPDPELKDGKITQNGFYDQAEDFVLDMTAFFSLLEEEAAKLIDKAEKEHWSADILIKEIEKLI